MIVGLFSKMTKQQEEVIKCGRIHLDFAEPKSFEKVWGPKTTARFTNPQIQAVPEFKQPINHPNIYLFL